MSFLAPLYALGLLAIAGPIILHLIRRQPNDNIHFSSLIFLAPTPPRLTKRSRVSNWLLLLLRALAIAALAIAFARPYLRETEETTIKEPGKRVVILLDTSASMKRAPLWQNSIEILSSTLDTLPPQDQIALVSFNDQATLQVDFDNDISLPKVQRDKLILSAAKELQPTSRATELGRALEFASELAMSTSTDETKSDLGEATSAAVGNAANGNTTSGNTADETGTSTTAMEPLTAAQVILISDMQTGSSLRSLQSYAWPSQLKLDLKPVQPSSKENVNISILPTSELDQKNEQVRIRIQNSQLSSNSEFQFTWINNRQESNGSQRIQVPPGQTRILTAPSPNRDTIAVRVDGDTAEFDNIYYFVHPKKTNYEVLFHGPTYQDKREDLFYYLSILPLTTNTRQLDFKPAQESALLKASSKSHPLIVLAQPVSDSATSSLRSYVETGGNLLCVMSQGSATNDMLDCVNKIGNIDLSSVPERKTDYSMLSRIDYGHPFFSSMADPQFSDFSKIKFWSHRHLVLPDPLALPDQEEQRNPLQTVASFDDDSPAIVVCQVGNGKLIILPFGWQPKESQLALSTKFYPLIESMLAIPSDDLASRSIEIGDPLPFPDSEDGSVSGSDSEPIPYRSSADIEFITDPGIYRYNNRNTSGSVAVNLAPKESRTDPLGKEDFESLGIAIGSFSVDQAETKRQRQLKDRELEANQGLWQWALIAALLLIAVETTLSGLHSRRSTAPSIASDAMGEPTSPV